MYVLVYVLDFITVFFQSGVFEYILVYSGCGGLLCISAKRICVRREYCFGGLRICGLSVRTSSRFENFVSAWLLLHVYVLVNVLDFVIVLFQGGVFEYMLVYSGWGRGCYAYLQNVFVYAEKTASGG